MSSISRRHALLLATTAVVTVPLTLKFAGAWPATAEHFGDNDAYVAVADALRAGDFRELVPQQFWGMPAVVALTSTMSGLDSVHALWLCSWVAAFVAIWLVIDLWGGTVGAWMGIVSFPWLQRAALGGNEPLFLSLALASLVLARRDRFLYAACVASLSATVRPMGLIAVLAIVVTLFRRRAWRDAAVALVIAAVVFGAYGFAIWRIYGDPLANVAAYRLEDFPDRVVPLDWPLLPFVRAWLMNPPSFVNGVKSVVWLALTLVGFGAWWRRGIARATWTAQPAEAVFAVAGLGFILCYNAPLWSQKEFARFVLPVVPFALAGLEPWLPTRRTVLWSVSILAGVLSAGSLLQT